MADASTERASGLRFLTAAPLRLSRVDRELGVVREGDWDAEGRDADGRGVGGRDADGRDADGRGVGGRDADGRGVGERGAGERGAGERGAGGWSAAGVWARVGSARGCRRGRSSLSFCGSSSSLARARWASITGSWRSNSTCTPATIPRDCATSWSMTRTTRVLAVSISCWPAARTWSLTEPSKLRRRWPSSSSRSNQPLAKRCKTCTRSPAPSPTSICTMGESPAASSLGEGVGVLRLRPKVGWLRAFSAFSSPRRAASSQPGDAEKVVVHRCRSTRARRWDRPRWQAGWVESVRPTSGVRSR